MILLSSCVNDSSKKDSPASGGTPATVNLLKALDITPANFNEDTASTITLSYSDVNSRLAQTCSLTNLNKISVSTACSCDGAGVCSVGVTGLSQANGSAGFRFNVAIGGEISSGAAANFTISPLDDAPVAAAITPAPFLFNTQSIITLAYSDADGDKATTCSTSSLSNVTVTQACACDASGVCTVGVTGTNNFIGSGSFNYTVTANSVVSNSVAATLTITGNPPVAANITPASFSSNIPSTITLSYTDVQNDLATGCSVSSLRNVYAASGCSCSSGVCSVTVVSNYNYVGSADFKYTVTAAGQISNLATASLTVTPTTPVAANITPPSFNEDINSIITLSYTDPLGRKATVCSISGATNITIAQACACDAAGVCTVGVKGTANYNGSANFNYTVTAGGQVSNSASASLVINAIDDAPVVANVTFADIIYEDTQSGILILNYSDVDGDRAAVGNCVITNPTNLTITQACACDVILGTCSLKMTGSLHYYGPASFDYKITTTSLTSNTSTASLTIIHKDHAPVSTNITPVAFNEDTQSIMTLAYTDIDNDKAATCTISSLGNVTVTQACACNGAGVCTVGVTGTANYNGAGSFYYTVTANGTISNSSTSTFTINSVDDAPVVANVTFPDLIYEDTQSGILTLNYSDVDGDRAAVGNCVITSPTNLTITQACACDVILGTCSLKMTGSLHYYGAASFSYKITTTTLTSNTGIASLTIIHQDHAPVSTNITPVAFNEDTQSILTLAYTDIDNDKAATCTISSLGNVTVTQACACNGAGVCTVGVTGTANYNGAGSFYYTVTANGVVSNSSTSTFTINNVDDAPVATNITPAGFDQNTQSIITLAYSDIDNDKATVCTISSLNNVTVTQACACNGAGVCTVGVTGTLNYSGLASFAYTVTANSVVSNSATANLSINFVNTAPTIAAIAATFANENTVYNLNFTINDIDGPLACSTAITATSSNTTLIPVASIVFAGTYPNCTAAITPANNIFGASNLTFKVTDGGGLNNSTAFIHTVRDGVTKTWLLGDAGDTSTYSYSSAAIETVAPGIIQLAPILVDQTDDTSSASGFTSLPTTLKWDAANSRVSQNHAVGAWTLASSVYSTTYSSRIMDAKKSVAWSSLAWKSTIPFGKEFPLTNESTSDYSLASGTLANSLIGLWHFNEGAGATTIKNSKTSTTDSFTVNSPAVSLGIAGEFSTSATFNAGTVFKSSTSAAVTPGAFSVSTWIKKTSAASEYVLCFWKVNDTTAATECPIRLSNVVRVRVNNTSYPGPSTINDGFWHNIVIVSNSLISQTEVYIDGVQENYGASPAPNYTTTGSVIYFGGNLANTGTYTGSIDETAIWNRVLTAGEITELYNRGASRLKMFYRTCSDSTCSTNPAWSTQLSELDNITSGEANAAAPSFTIAPTNDRFFQYKTIFETESLPTVAAPDLKNVVVGPVHYSYATTEENFVTQEGLSFKTLSNFVSTLGAQGCAGSGGGVHYQLSKDKVTWSYYNGSAWGTGTNFATSSTSAQLLSGIPTYTSASNTVSDTAYIRTILKSDSLGGSPCEVGQLKLDGNE